MLENKRRRKRRAPVQLHLAARGRRGGYRDRAGRPKGKRTSTLVPHVTRPAVTKNNGVHVTLRCVVGVPTLRHPVAEGIIKRIFTAERKRKGFRLAHYSIQGNHLHLICEALDAPALSRGIQRIGARIARRLNKRFERTGKFFADRFHGEVIKTPRQMRNALRYVYLNMHKDKAKRGLRYTGVDTYTSHQWFDGWAPEGRSAPRVPVRGDPVAEPRCWLLRVGWLRGGGPIRTNEMAPLV